jgi:predicted GNAT family acetyltransferase
MLALAKMTKPGPFGMRTRELGTYLGIRIEGQLAAMAGERLHLPGYTEISAVCTHPNHVGRGYARTLMVELIRQIRNRNEIPILHVRPENARAIELYRRLGFADRHLSRYAVIRKSAPRL